MKEYVFVIVLLCCSAAFGSLEKDPSRIIPGRLAEGVYCGSDMKEVLASVGEPDKLIRLHKEHDLFYNVYKLSASGIDIKYDALMYYNDKRVIFFLKEKVVAIIGFSTKRNISDKVTLQKGVDYFIYSYGNKGLKIIKKDGHVAYLYRKKGIVVFDDKADDSIDLYMVFLPVD